MKVKIVMPCKILWRIWLKVFGNLSKNIIYRRKMFQNCWHSCARRVQLMVNFRKWNRTYINWESKFISLKINIKKENKRYKKRDNRQSRLMLATIRQSMLAWHKNSRMSLKNRKSSLMMNLIYNQKMITPKRRMLRSTWKEECTIHRIIRVARLWPRKTTSRIAMKTLDLRVKHQLVINST